MRNWRIIYDLKFHKADIFEVNDEVKQDLINFDESKLCIYSNKVVKNGLLTENQIRQSKINKNTSTKKPVSSKGSSRNISMELNTSNTSNAKKSVYKHIKNDSFESDSDISAINIKNKGVDVSRLDNSFDEFMKCDFNKGLAKYRQYTDTNTTLFNIS